MANRRERNRGTNKVVQKDDSAPSVVAWLDADDAIRGLGVAAISNVGNGVVRVEKNGNRYAFRPLVLNGYVPGPWDFTGAIVFGGTRHDVAVALQDRHPSIGRTDAESRLYREVKGELARQAWKALEGGATFAEAGISFGRDGRFTEVRCKELVIARLEGVRTRNDLIKAVRYNALGMARPFEEVLMAEFMDGQRVSFDGPDGREREAQYCGDGAEHILEICVGEHPRDTWRMEPWQAETYFLGIGDPSEALGREARAERSAALAAIGDVEHYAVLRQQGGTGWAIVLPKEDEYEKCSLVRCDARGVWHESVYKDRGAAVDAAIADGYTVRDDALLGRMLSNPKFDRSKLSGPRLARASAEVDRIEVSDDSDVNAEISKLGLVPLPTDRAHGTSYGSMVAETEHSMVQGIGQGRCVVHRKDDFHGDRPDVGDRVWVRYVAGRAIVGAQERAKLRQSIAVERD